jgi:hypothetical protein
MSFVPFEVKVSDLNSQRPSHSRSTFLGRYTVEHVLFLDDQLGKYVRLSIPTISYDSDGPF